MPLLKNVPGAQELTANVSGRWANYDSYGSGSTYKAGMLWTPAKWLTLRATKGTSYRAPALFEQNLGATSGFLSSNTDPCNNWDASTTVGTARRANCQSEGLPAGFTATQGVTVISSGGRAAGLKAETSDNKTVGIVLQPELPTGWGDFSLSVDYFDIKVDNGVARAGAPDILTRCYDDAAFRGGGGFCRLIAPRNPTTNALTVSDGYVNLATDIVRGNDITARYTNDIGLGRLDLNLSVTEFREQANKLFAENQLTNHNGTLTRPKWSGVLDAKYTVKEWTYYYSAEWVGQTSSYELVGEDGATSTFKLDTPTYLQQSASVRYKDAVGKWSVTLGVRNLADVKPPMISAQAGYNRVGNAPLYSGVDYSGRRFFLNASKTF